MVPDEDARGQQKSWDYPAAEHKRDRLLLDTNQFDRARILGAATPESGAWLRALPAAILGTHLDNETVRVAVALRIGADVCSGVHACRCGSPADVKGYHALTCKFSAGRLPRHTALNDIVRRALLFAGLPAQLEPYGVDRGDGERPGGMSILPFSQGRCLVWDSNCVNPRPAGPLDFPRPAGGGGCLNTPRLSRLLRIVEQNGKRRSKAREK